MSARQHETVGYTPRKTVVVPNGFDCERFRPLPEARDRLRRSLGLEAAPGAPLIGMVARNHPMKDASNLLAALALLRETVPGIHLILVGRGFGPKDPDAAAAVARAGLTGMVGLLGERDDVHTILPGLDVLALPSAWGEGFPNVLGEAMACGVPCVTTDVGDSAWIVGQHGLIVPPRDSAALAAALRQLVELGPDSRERLGRGARTRIIADFSLTEVARRYADLYAGVAADRPARRHVWSRRPVHSLPSHRRGRP